MMHIKRYTYIIHNETLERQKEIFKSKNREITQNVQGVR